MEVALPLEAVISAVPISLQGSADAKAAWKTQVIAAATKNLEGHEWAVQGPVAVTIFYFPDAEMQGDLDNIAKPILDALQGPIYIDDHQVAKLVLQKFEPGGLVEFKDPTAALIEAIQMEGPVLYIRVDRNLDPGGGA